MEFFNKLQFVEVEHMDKKIALLADEDGKRIPGQTAIHISDPDQNNVRMVTVIFEVMADVPEGCFTSCNIKENFNSSTIIS